MKQQYRYFATCPKGMEDLLAHECTNLQLQEVVLSQGGVYFSGDLKAAYSMCLWSRLASRVLLELTQFEVDDYDQLYEAACAVNWG